MPVFQKGNPGGPGRKPGTPNKITKDLRQLILRALEGAGGQKYLERQAVENPQAFLALVGKVVPKEVEVEGKFEGLPQLNIIIDPKDPRMYPVPGPAPELTEEQKLVAAVYPAGEQRFMDKPIQSFAPPAEPATASAPAPAPPPAAGTLWNDRFLAREAARR